MDLNVLIAIFDSRKSALIEADIEQEKLEGRSAFWIIQWALVEFRPSFCFLRDLNVCAFEFQIIFLCDSFATPHESEN